MSNVELPLGIPTTISPAMMRTLENLAAAVGIKVRVTQGEWSQGPKNQAHTKGGAVDIGVKEHKREDVLRFLLLSDLHGYVAFLRWPPKFPSHIHFIRKELLDPTDKINHNLVAQYIARKSLPGWRRVRVPVGF